MDTSLEQFRGRVAVITGAGSGIGEALARQASTVGMRVVLADIDEARAQGVAQAITTQGGEAVAIATDVSDPASLDALADTCFDTFGEVTLLVNNAGIETLGFAWELSAPIWERALGVNINGVVHGVRAFAPRMIAAGKPGFIANTSSVGGFGIMPVQTPYIMSKHAVLAFSECLRMEMAIKEAPVSVSVILPALVKTRIFEDSQASSDTMSQHHRQVMAGMLAENGISSDEAAQRILPQIAAGDFWVSTDEQMTRDFAAARARTLTELPTPALAPEVAASMLGE